MNFSPRFAVISLLDTVLFESNDAFECWYYLFTTKEKGKGVYDYQQFKYLDFADTLDLMED